MQEILLTIERICNKLWIPLFCFQKEWDEGFSVLVLRNGVGRMK